MLAEPAKVCGGCRPPRLAQRLGHDRGMHARSHGLVCTLGITHYPSLASAEVAEDSADSGRSLSVGIRAKNLEANGPLRNRRPVFRVPSRFDSLVRVPARHRLWPGFIGRRGPPLLQCNSEYG